jgi:hypothetical protein
MNKPEQTLEQEPKKVSEKICNDCKIVLNETNKVKNSNMCKSCKNIKYKEYLKNKVSVKICDDCEIALNETNKAKDRNICKSCKNIKYKEYVKNKLSKMYEQDVKRNCSTCSIELTKENQVKNRPTCKNCYNATRKDYKKNNKDLIIESNKEYYKNNKAIINEKNHNAYVANREKYLAKKKEWKNKNRDTYNAKVNERFRTNPIARLKRNCRTKINHLLKSNSLNPKSTILKLLDCTFKQLKEWLQSNFKEGMTFDNYGSFWSVDHVIPCAKFDLSKDDDIKNCFRWCNIQPLEGQINSSKQDKINKDEIIEHYKKANIFATTHNIKLNDFNYNVYTN